MGYGVNEDAKYLGQHSRQALGQTDFLTYHAVIGSPFLRLAPHVSPAGRGFTCKLLDTDVCAAATAGVVVEGVRDRKRMCQ